MLPGRRRALALAGIGAGAALTGAFFGALLVQSESGAAELLGAPFTDLEGRTRRLIEWQGQVVACNFWATWCAPCREEVPLFVAAQQQYASKGFTVIGIAVDQAAKVRDFAVNYGINYPILLAGSPALEIMRKLGNAAGALPYTVILDRSARVATQRLGAFHKEELEKLLARMLG